MYLFFFLTHKEFLVKYVKEEKKQKQQIKIETKITYLNLDIDTQKIYFTAKPKQTHMYATRQKTKRSVEEKK